MNGLLFAANPCGHERIVIDALSLGRESCIVMDPCSELCGIVKADISVVKLNRITYVHLTITLEVLCYASGVEIV